METLAKSLSYYQRIDRPVVDRTNLTGTFDLTLDYPPFVRTPSATADLGATDSSLPSTIFEAIQEQLGLKLEPATAPVDVLVVDHVEEPSPN